MHRKMNRTLIAILALSIAAVACSPSPVSSTARTRNPTVGLSGRSRYKIASTTSTSTSTSTTTTAKPRTTTTTAKATTTTAAPAASGNGSSAPATSQQTPRDPALWPFSINSPFNTPVGTGAQFASDNDSRSQAMRNLDANINAGSWSIPVYTASSSDPFTTVNGSTFQIPSNATPSLPYGGDQNLLVIDPTHRYVDEMWSASGSGSYWSAGYHVRNDITGPGIGNGGVRAAGVSSLGGLIRNWELYFGSIRHALAMALPRSLQQPGSVWPAESEDYDARSTYGGNIPIGTLFAIPSSVDLNSLGLTPQGLVVARALQQFGAYDLDSADGNAVFYAEPTAEGSIGNARGDISKLVKLLRPITNNTAGSVGGGGSPTAPTAPPLDR